VAVGFADSGTGDQSQSLVVSAIGNGG